jgi:uncharacterized membrane protein YphA (DoxX/SURF4 family)
MAKDTRTWQRRFVTVLCWFIAVQLFLFGPLKFSPVGFFGYPSYPEKFIAWGYPPWFSFVVGAGEIFASVMLILPRRRFLGAAVMLFILTGALATHIINRDSLADSIAAPIILMLSTIIALANWPADWREPLALSRQESLDIQPEARNAGAAE